MIIAGIKTSRGSPSSDCSNIPKTIKNNMIVGKQMAAKNMAIKSRPEATRCVIFAVIITIKNQIIDFSM